MERTFQGVPESVFKCVHICCGYTNVLDDDNCPKANNHAYIQLSEGIESLDCINAVSIEDAHTRIPLEFFNRMKNTKVILGCVRVCSNHELSVEEMVKRTKSILDETEIKPEQILLAPDCGMGMLKWEQAVSGLKKLNEVATMLRKEYS